MTVFTEGRHATEGLMSEAEAARSREAITIVSGAGVIAPGTVLGMVSPDRGAVTVGTPTAAAGNTGNGTLTKANPAYGAGVKEGTYRIVAVEPITNLGTFTVEDPDGVTIGVAKVGVAFDDVIKFTIADGATDFVAGDTFTLAVSIADPAAVGKYKPSAATGNDGSEVAVAIALYGCDATSADQDITAIVRAAQWKGSTLTYDSSVDDDTKKAAKAAQLKKAGIVVR